MSSHPTITLSLPRMRIIFGDVDTPTTWEAVEVQTIGRDMQRVEEIFARHKNWGSTSDNPIRLSHLLAWAALNRKNVFPGSFDKFVEEIIEVQDVDEDDDQEDDEEGDGYAGETAVPTQLAAAGDSS